MADGVLGKQIQCIQLTFDNTTTGGKVANLNGVGTVILSASADCYVDFDQPIATSQSFKLLSSNTNPLLVDMKTGLVDKIYCQGVNGSGTLYIISIAN